MRQFLFGILFLTAIPTLLFAQSMKISPDSGNQGQQLSVTIVGSGMRFAATNNVSFVGVVLERSGSSSQSSSASLLNDSTIHASIQVPSGMPVGSYYDMIVEVVDTTEHTYTQYSAFYVNAPPPGIASVSPSSAYNSQTDTIQITGESTNFLAGSSPTISFQKNGTTYFSAQTGTISSDTSMNAFVTIPGGTPAGSYDIIVRNGTYSDTGKNKFSSLGPAPTTAHVPMRMTPDSGYPQQQLSVTIVGSGTNFGSTNNLSEMSVMLEHSGSIFDEASSAYVTNDSTIQASLQVSSGMTVGNYYDLVVQVTDSTEHTFIQDSAFHVIAAPAKLLSVSPGSGYSGQSLDVTVTGQSTNFPQHTLYLYLTKGPMTNTKIVLFFDTVTVADEVDSVFSATELTGRLNIPSSDSAGAYDLYLMDLSTHSAIDSGIGIFQVLGPMPTVALVPDSGAASTTFGVTIVGQYTSFAPTGNISEPLPLNIDFDLNGISYYHTTADTVLSAIAADAVFTLSDSLTPGMYDAVISGSTYTGGSYALHTPFLVAPHPIIIVGNNHLPRADTVTITVTGTSVNFISGTQDVTTVKLVKEDPDTITASKVTVTSNTTLTAFFTVPANASPGFYDVAITEPGTNRIVTAPSEFSVGGVFSDSACYMSPDTGSQGEEVSGCLGGMDFGSATIDSMYLQQGASTIPVFVETRLPPCLPIGVIIPPSASSGSYDLVLVLGGDGLGDTAVVKNAFTVQAAAGVGDSPAFSELVENLHVSPNPAQDFLSVSFATNAPSHAHLWLYDELGRTVATLCDRTIGTGAQSFDWPAQNFPNGSYFYELTAGEEMYGGRIVVRH